MNQEQLDKIREKLYTLQMSVEADVWKGISASLRRRRAVKLFWWASSVAAAAVVLLFLVIGNGTVQPENLVAEQLEIEQQVQPQLQHQPEPQLQLKEEPQPVQKEEGQTGQQLQKDPQEKQQVQLQQESQPQHQPQAGPQLQQEQEEPQYHEDLHPADRQQSIESYKDSFEKVYIAESRPQERKYALALVSGVMPGSSASISGSMIRATSAGAGNISQSYTIEQISDTKYSLPLNLGVQFQFLLKNNMAIGIGVNYTMLRSTYDCLINKKSFNVKQALHYIGIPVNIYGQIVDRNNFSFYLNAGAAVEKGIRAVYHLKSYDQTERNSSPIDGVHFSVNAGMGVEYKLNNTLGLYLEPNIVYHMNSDVPRSIRTDQPLQVEAELGFRFRF